MDLLRHELIEGLTAEQMYISSKFFYDKNGSKLFEWITRLPEYYPTRTEKTIIREYGHQLFAHLNHVDIVELGSGDSTKISLALDAIPKNQRESITYRPIDFSSVTIERSKKILSKRYPELNIEGEAADFTKLKNLPNGQPRIICFFGSTIGNFEPEETQNLLSNISQLMNPGDQLLVGMDMIKDLTTLQRAYNDSQRITEAFNKNILRACNNILGTNFFIPDYDHRAFYNEEKNRIEMHLEARSDQFIKSSYFTGRIMIKKGETIHTENSHKYSFETIEQLAHNSQLSVRNVYNDSQKWFSLVQMVK